MNLDTGKMLPINAFLSILPLFTSFFYYLPFYHLPPACSEACTFHPFTIQLILSQKTHAANSRRAKHCYKKSTLLGAEEPRGAATYIATKDSHC